jgi:hypothetical protein
LIDLAAVGVMPLAAICWTSASLTFVSDEFTVKHKQHFDDILLSLPLDIALPQRQPVIRVTGLTLIPASLVAMMNSRALGRMSPLSGVTMLIGSVTA